MMQEFFDNAESMRFWNVPVGSDAEEWFAGKRVYDNDRGFLAVQISGHRAGIEFGTLPAHRNDGVATRLVKHVSDLLLKEDAIRRVWAVVDCENEPSRRVMIKAGFTLEGICKKYLVAPNIGPEPRDVYFFARVK